MGKPEETSNLVSPDQDTSHLAPPEYETSPEITTDGERRESNTSQRSSGGTLSNLGQKLKDKVTSSTAEERSRRRSQEYEHNARQQRIRDGAARARATGIPQCVGQDEDGYDMYVEGPMGPPEGWVYPDRAYNMDPRNGQKSTLFERRKEGDNDAGGRKGLRGYDVNGGRETAEVINAGNFKGFGSPPMRVADDGMKRLDEHVRIAFSFRGPQKHLSHSDKARRKKREF